MSKFYHVNIAGYVHLAVRVNGTLYVLHRIGRIGDCIRS